MQITQEVRAFALEQANRRCECTGEQCRHHLRGGRCKRGLRGDEWKVFWQTEDGGVTRDNIQAWCPECFANNFEAPREMVALLALDIVGYHRLVEEDHRKATTLKSVLRDVAKRCAEERHGRLVFDRLDDDILAEFQKTRDAIKAARGLRAGFRDMALRLDLPIADLSGAIHSGEVTRWRNGLLVGDAVEVMTSIRSLAGADQIVLTETAVGPVRGKIELEPIAQDDASGPVWTMSL